MSYLNEFEQELYLKLTSSEPGDAIVRWVGGWMKPVTQRDRFL
jgi:hypothetical protein